MSWIASDTEATSWPELQTAEILKSDIATWSASNSLAKEKDIVTVSLPQPATK